MKNDLTCGVVRDLLPSYVEGLTSPESNTAVERHLSECPDCAQLRTALAGAPKQAAPEDAKEVDYLKKVKRPITTEFIIHGHGQRRGNDNCKAVCQRTVLHTEELPRNEYEARADEGHEYRHGHHHPHIGPTLIEVCGNCPQHNRSQRLVCPREVSPHHVEIDKCDRHAHGKERHADHQTARDAALLDMEDVGYDESGRTERRIARGDVPSAN